MKAWRLLLALLVALWLGRADAEEPAAAPEDSGRQLLVMLQLPRPHFRPDGPYGAAYGERLQRLDRRHTAEQLAQQHGLELQLGWPIPLVGVDCFVLRLPAADARSATQAAEAVAADTRVAWAQPMHLYQAEGSEQEPMYAAQPAARQWQLAELHRASQGRGSRVAVVDSGIELDHPDLAGQIVFNANLVDDRPGPAESHGTAVAGIIAARSDNHEGIAGIAPQARLLALRACWQAGDDRTLCNSLGLARALHLAIEEKAHIINLSLSGPEDRLLGLLLDQALARGIAVVAAQPGARGGFPASHAGVLVVGNQPPTPSGGVLAPGRDIPATAPHRQWTLVSGSSFAAAHASGLLALAHEIDARSTRGTALRETLVTGVDGRIDGCATLAHLAPRELPHCSPAPAQALH
jgi:hypothetical protein